MIKVSNHLAREIIVINTDGSRCFYKLSIAKIIEIDGIVANVEVCPFEREMAGVVYHDKPLIITIGASVARSY